MAKAEAAGTPDPQDLDEEEAGPSLDELEATSTKIRAALRKAKSPAERAKLRHQRDQVDAQIEASEAGEESDLRDHYKTTVTAILNKAKLPEAPYGINGFTYQVIRDDKGEITAEEITIVLAGGSRRKGSKTRSASRAAGSGFKVSGIGDFGSWSGAGRAVRESLGQHPAVRGATFWKDSKGVSVKDHQDGDSSWSAATGSVWFASAKGTEFTLTVTR